MSDSDREQHNLSNFGKFCDINFLYGQEFTTFSFVFFFSQIVNELRLTDIYDVSACVSL